MKTRSTAAVLLLAAAALFGAACSDSHHVVSSGPAMVQGNGNVVEESRAVGAFTRIHLQGVGNLYVRQGAREELRVRAEENLLEYLKTETRAGELVIWKDGGTLLNTAPIEYHLTLVDLERAALAGAGRIEGSDLHTGVLTLRLSGVGSIELANLTASGLDVESSGVGDVTLSGSTQEQSIRLSGLGNYNGDALASVEADVLIARSGSATVRVRDRLTATINGSGNIYYIGDPTVDSSISGSGRVERIGG